MVCSFCQALKGAGAGVPPHQYLSQVRKRETKGPAVSEVWTCGVCGTGWLRVLPHGPLGPYNGWTPL
jgi:hypothetical protein